MIGDTALPNKGTMSVGVLPQHCGQLGRKANCQPLVSLALAQGEVPIQVALRLFPPEKWTDGPVRCAQAGVRFGTERTSISPSPPSPVPSSASVSSGVFVLGFQAGTGRPSRREGFWPWRAVRGHDQDSAPTIDGAC